MATIELERVVFDVDVDKPRTKTGSVPGGDKVFDRARTGRTDRYELFLIDRSFVVIRDPESGNEECVPFPRIKQFRVKAEKK